jgi:hypothetical protein
MDTYETLADAKRRGLSPATKEKLKELGWAFAGGAAWGLGGRLVSSKDKNKKSKASRTARKRK